LLALRNGQSEVAVGVLLSCFALTQIFLSIPAGRFADRHGFKRPMMLGVLVASLGVAASAVWPIFPVMCLSALCCGGAAGAAILALQRHVGQAARDHNELKRAFSWLAVGPAASNFMGPLAAGLMIDHVGFRSAFALLAIFPLLSWFWVRHVKEIPVPTPTDAPVGTRVWDLLQVPMFRRLMLVNWFLSSCWDVHTFMVPVIGHEYGVSASAIGAVLGVFALSAALIRLLLPAIAARFPEWKILGVAMLVTGLLLGLYPLMHEAWTMGALSALLGLFLGAVQPMVMSTMHQITPQHRQGEALGLRLMTINASSVIMPMMFGALGAGLGVSGVFWLVSLSVASASRLAWKLKVRKPGG
jgi:MFS family permease